MSLVLNGARVETPGRDTRSWLDDPSLPQIGDRRGDDGFRRSPGDVTGVTAHASKGKVGPLLPGLGPAAEDAERLARYQDGTDRDVSWHFTVDRDGTVVQSADPGLWACWHAGQVNGRTVGIELVQRSDMALYAGQVEAFVWLVGLLCDRYGVPRTVPVGPDGRPWAKIIPELMKAPEGDSGRSWRGVYGHRNCSRRRGVGDPGDPPMAALLAAGFAPVPLDRKGRRVAGPACGEAPGLAACPAPPPPPGVAAWPALPAWVDASREVTDTADRTDPPGVWAHAAMGHLTALGVPRELALGAVAHCATECAWGRRAVGHNHGGVKLKERDSLREERRTGEGLAWWRWAGHREAGDDAVVYYRAFDDDRAFWSFWLARYAPKSADVAEGDRYVKTGAAFWSGRPWFVELLRAGYRGPVREREIAAMADPSKHPSVVEHARNVERVRSLLAAP